MGSVGHVTATMSDNPTESRFEIHQGEALAGFAQYVRSGSRLTLTHTEVDDAFAGQGLAKALAAGVLAQAREEGLAVLPKCPFMAKYIRRNPEWVDLVPEDRRTEFGL